MKLMVTDNQLSLITVLLVGTHDLLRDSLANLVSIQADMELAGTVFTNHEVIERAAFLQPDVILIDLSISDMENLGPIQKIHQANPHIHIIAMSGFPRKALVDNMMKAGVERFIKRGDSSQSIVNAIRDVCQKEKEE